MSNIKKELIIYRLNRAKESFAMASIAASKKYWNSAASELYYTCYYCVIALFAKNDIKTSTHSGVRTKLGLNFIKENKLDVRWGKFLSKLFDLRQDGDYGDFMVLREEEISPLVMEAEEFMKLIESMISDEL
jgi:uncharacterized protein (UPF0332 family)